MSDAPWTTTQAEMRRAGVDALLIADPVLAQRIGGFVRIAVHVTKPAFPTLFLPVTGAPHVCTPDPDGALHLPADHVHAIAFDQPALATYVAAWLGDAAQGRVAHDAVPLDALRLLRAAMPDATFVMWGEHPLHEGYRLTEAAVEKALPQLEVGMTERDAQATFRAAARSIGLETDHIDHVFRVIPARAAQAPWRRGEWEHAPPWSQLTTDHALAVGDHLAIDAGFAHHGWMTDFGATYVVGREANEAEIALAAEWTAIADRVTAAIRPGNTAADLTAAALTGWRGDHPPWPHGLYVAHGVGFGGVVPPFAGTDLGPNAERAMVLEVGQVILVEPFVWRDGVGGYRAERCVCVTDDGCDVWTRLPIETFASVG